MAEFEEQERDAKLAAMDVGLVPVGCVKFG